MKVFDQIDLKRLHSSWRDRANPEVSYYGGREVAFSPAVQAQVSPFGNGGTGEMPTYASLHGVLIPFEYTGWLDESKAISESCYLGDWSWLNKFRIKGKDAIPCMEASTINGYKKFPVGKGRHIISVTPDGKMIGDGAAFREAEDQFLLTGGQMLVPGAMIRSEGFDVEVQDVTSDLFNFHLQGPNSGKVIQALCGEDVSDLEFIHFREITICGHPVRLYRGGMSGELGYELFGDSAFGSVIWKAAVEAGQPFGLRQLGYRAFMLNHLQAFFPTIWVDFIPSVIPGAEALYRSPVDYGWGNLIDKTRDFPGKAILMEEMANPTRKSVTLVWNAEDCISVFASLFDTTQEPFQQMELPVNVASPAAGNPPALPVFSKEGKMLGLLTNRGYSYQFRKYLSLALLDIDYTAPGTEVFVLYGNENSRQTKIRATVAEVPYKKDGRR